MLILKVADGAFSLQTEILFEASHNKIINMFALFRSFAFGESLLYVQFKESRNTLCIDMKRNEIIVYFINDETIRPLCTFHSHLNSLSIVLMSVMMGH